MSCQLDGCCVTFPKDAVIRASVKTQLSVDEKEAVSCLIDPDRLPDWAKRRKLVVQSGGNGESKFTTACKWIGAGGLDPTPPSWAPMSPAKVSLACIESFPAECVTTQLHALCRTYARLPGLKRQTPRYANAWQHCLDGHSKTNLLAGPYSIANEHP
jgi:hypothetical protein